MNAPIVVAQANSTGSTTGTGSVRTIKVTKPANEHAVTIQLGYDQAYKLDLSAISNEKITLVHIGEKLIILFENKSTVTVEPFFDSMNAPLSNVTVEANGRDFTGSEFASSFPITTDQSVLTAAGVSAAGTPSSGADFHGPSVDPLNERDPLDLLGQEELPNWVATQQLGPAGLTTSSFVDTTPPTANAALFAADEKGLPGQEGEGGSSNVGSGEIFDGNAFNNSDPSEETSGALSFSDSDGTAHVSAVNGTPVIADGTVIVGAHGVLVINLDGTFTYTLTGNDLNHHSQGTGSDGEADVFTYTVEDSSGNTQTSTLTIDILDDVPTARPDTDTIAAGASIADGNVINGAGTNEGFNGAGHDIQGADGATVTGVVAGANGSAITDGSGLGGIAGNFGTLTLNSNGSYEYVRTAGTPGGVSDVFTYTLTDGDGDTSVTTLTIDIANGAPTLHVPSLQEPGTQVNEAGLPARGGEPAGSASATNSEITSGTISFTSLDGVSSVQINSVAVTPGSLPQTIASDATGTLVITSYSFNAGTGAGSINYTYTLTDNTLTDPSSVAFDVKVTDADSDAVSSTLTINIVDDTPLAVNDTDILSNQTHTATGNVITAADTTSAGADTQGADGAIVSAILSNNPGGSGLTGVGAGGVTINGQFGTLTIAEDGTYTYARTGTGSLTAIETFTYTLQDGDGDISPATLTININDGGVTINGIGAAGGDQTVNEANLLNGSSPSNAALTQSGTFNISAPDGFGDLTIGGVNVVTGGVVTLPGLPITMTYGQLTITGVNLGTGVVSYSYKLTTDALVSGISTLDSVSVHLTDTDTSFADSTLTIKVLDDAPVAHADTGSVNEGALLTAAASGVLINDAPGADGYAAGGGVVGIRAAGGDTTTAVAGGLNTNITGLHGTLILQANGSYTYQSTANNITSNTTDVFVYTIKDGDGDLSTTTLTINLANATIIAPTDNDVTVNEAALDTTITGSDLAAGTITGSLGTTSPLETDASNQLNATGGVGTLHYALASGGNAATAGIYGTIKINDDGSYVYTLTKPVTESTANNGADTVNAAESFTYKVTDTNGNTTNGTININIVDDVPTAGFTLGSSTITIDETAGIQANDHSGAWPLATPAGAGAIMGWAQSAGSVVGSDTSTGGADGKASVAYALTTAGGTAFNGVDSGVKATVSGNEIWLFTEGNLVVGREGSGVGGITANAGGAVAFAIGLDGSNNLDVAQYEAIKHANASNANDSTSLTSGLLHVTQTVTDGDGDKATSTNAGGLSLTFTDDGPTAPTVSASAVTVAIDETPGVQGGAANDIAGSTVVTFNGASITVANLFATAPNKGLDTDVASAALDNGALSYATSGASIVTLTGGSFGADGPAASGATATTYALFVNNQSSGLTLTDGTPITLALDGNGRAIGTVGNDAANPSLTGKTAFAIMIDPSNGQVYVAQYLSLHNPDSTNPNDPVTLTSFSVMVTATLKDGDGDTITSALGDISTHVNFLDDGPSANAVTKNLASAGHDTNIMLILDTSGSMGDASGIPGLTRLQAMKAAVTDLLEGYGDIGDVRVQIVQFNSNGAQVGSNWMTIAQAEAAVNSLTAGGTTDYDAAVATALGIYGAAGKIATAGVQNVSYFMSDGVPNESNGTGTNGIVGAEITNWQTFLSNNSINGFALGMGAGATQSTLDPLAYNGVTHVDTNAVIVTDLSQLSSALVGTVNSTGGNILTDGILPGSYGADGGHVQSITVNGTTYTYDPSGAGSISVSGTNHGSFDTTTNTETVTLNSGGVLTMMMDNGTYGYTAPTNVSAGYTDSIQFLLTDNDGDTAGNTLTIVVSAPNHAPSITSNGGGTTASISVNENATAVTTVTSTDTDGPSAIYSIAGGADAAKFSINASTGALTFIAAPNFEAPTDAGANNVYDVTVQVSDGTLTDTQAIAVTVANVNDSAPVITSNGGGATAAVNVAENSTAVTTVVATDADLTTPTYSISGGADAAKFTINASTGVLTFISAPNFEAPTDAGANNVYDVIVRASDGTNFDDQAIAVTVTNANEAPTAVNDNLISNFGGNAYSVPEWAFLSNDSDPDGNAIDVNATPSESGLSSIGHTAGVGTNGTIDIDDNSNGSNGNTFAYNVTDGSLVSSNATVTVDNQNGGDLTGTGSNEILFGDNNGNTFNGAGGNDIILAGGGNDTLIGGTGNDILVGGTGADHFRYTSTSDGGTIVNQAGADHILDFSTAQGDVIDISKAAFSASGLPNAGNALNGTTFGSSTTDTFGSVDERFHFNTTTHTLLYDSNGSSAGGTQVAIAILENGGTVDAAHILMVA